jgi:glycosyltransferase EpsE
MILFDETGDWGRTREPIKAPKITDFVKNTPFHCHAPCMIRREAYLDVEGYTVDKRLLRYEDCNLWFKLYGKGYRGYNLSKPLYKMRDDRNAAARRTASSRLRGVYVLYTGFKLVNMPKKYYFQLIIEFAKDIVLILMPGFIYRRLHKKKQNG